MLSSIVVDIIMCCVVRGFQDMRDTFSSVLGDQKNRLINNTQVNDSLSVKMTQISVGVPPLLPLLVDRFSLISGPY